MTAGFSDPAEQTLDPVLQVPTRIRFKMKLGNPPQAQTAGQLVTQIMPPVLETCQSITLDLLVTPDSHQDMGVAAVG